MSRNGYCLLRHTRRTRTTDQRRLLHREQLGKCWYCTKTIPFHLSTVDHVLPLSKGGRNRMNNLVMACPTCNSAKANKRPEEGKTQRRLQWLRSQPVVEWTPGTDRQSAATKETK